MTVGEALAQARYRAGLSVDELSERTKIREAVIRGIEQDDYVACGGDLYVRGYLRAIAGAVGIDAQPLIRQYDLRQADVAAPPQTRQTPQVPEAPQTPEAESTPATDALPAVPAVPAVTRPQPILTRDATSAPLPAELLADDPDPDRGRLQRRAAAIVVLALIVAGTAAGLVVSGLNHGQHTKAAAASAASLQRARHSAGTQQGAGSKAAAQAAASSPAASVSATPKASAAKPEPEHATTPAKPRAAAPARVRALPVKLAMAFGPDGVADGDNPQIAMFAVTRDSPLPWQSQWYVTPAFGMLKSGTGLLLDMGHRVTVTSVRIELGPYAGADLQLRVGDKAALSGLRVAARADGAGGSLRLRFRSAETGRYLLIWFTLLPPDGAGTYQVFVHQVTVQGQP